MSIVDDQGLKDLLAYIEPGYSIPSRTHITAVLKRQYELALGKVRELLNSDDGVALSFTTDIWTSAAVEAYLTLTGHFLTADFTLMSCCLGTGAFPERHTGVNIAAKVRSMLGAFRVPQKHQVALVHDQAANMELAGRTLEEKRDFYSVVCTPHRLQNTIKAGLEVPRVSKLLASARKIVTHFKHSVVGMEAIRKRQDAQNEKRLKFIQDVATRWNSSLHMIKRLLLLRPHVTAILKDETVTKAADRQLDLHPEQYGLMESLIEILKRFEAATTILSAEKTVTISCVLHIVVELASILEVNDTDSVTISQVKTVMLRDLQRRFSLKPFDAETMEAMSAILDPRFHHASTLSRLQHEEITDAVLMHLQRMFPVTEVERSSSDDEPQAATTEPPAKRRPTALEMMLPKKLSTDKQKAQTIATSDRSVEQEFTAFLAEDEIGINEDPLLWWRDHSKAYPRVCQLARKWLAVPASSTSSERMCSTSGHVAEQRRARLSPANVNMLVFLNKNWSLLANYRPTTTMHVKAEEDADARQGIAAAATECDSDFSEEDAPALPRLFS